MKITIPAHPMTMRAFAEDEYDTYMLIAQQ